MAKLKIYTFPDIVLAQKALPISRVDKSYFKVADDMLETMYDAPGIGLAANQVGLLERIIVIDTEYEREDLEGDEFPEASQSSGGVITNKKPIILINPEIIHREGSIRFTEGCLSVPEYSEEVDRSEKIKVQYQDVDGLTKTLSMEGLQAVCLQHEIDHLNGTLFIDHLSPVKKDMIKKKLIKRKKEEKE